MNSAVDLERIPRFLADLGACGAVLEELLRYNENAFVFDRQTLDARFPLNDEPFIAAWQGYFNEAKEKGVFGTLQTKLAQLAFPIASGISETAEYLADTRQGKPPAPGSELQLLEPESLELIIHPTLAGRLPILVTRSRADFESLLRALTLRNEPSAVPRPGRLHGRRLQQLGPHRFPKKQLGDGRFPAPTERSGRSTSLRSSRIRSFIKTGSSSLATGTLQWSSRTGSRPG